MQLTLRRAHEAEAHASSRRHAADAAAELDCDGLRSARGIVNAIIVAVVLDVLIAAGVIALITLA
jgi:hypothetical protein